MITRVFIGISWIGSLLFAFGVGYNLAAGGPIPLGSNSILVGAVIFVLSGITARVTALGVATAEGHDAANQDKGT